MPQVGEIQWHVSGDIGGTGVSRFRFTRQDSGNLTGTDVAAAAAATRSILAGLTTYIPTAVSWQCQAQVNVYDINSGLVQPPWILGSIPSQVTGSGSGTYAGGNGMRLNWKTSTIEGRRLLRGATFLVPCASGAYTGSGGVIASAQSAANSGAASYLTAMAAASLEPVVWHRPLKGTTSGGLIGIIISGVASSVPATLRSRRE